MAQIKKVLAVILAACLLISVGIVVAGAVEVSKDDSAAEPVGAGGIIVHYYCESGTPTIYYWNSLPTNVETTYPGKAMTKETNNFYKYTFPNLTKVNMLFVVNGTQSVELTRNTGEWWYKNNKWYDHDPANITQWDRSDLREDSIYFVMTTRFYDGDPSNNVHCWDDSNAGNGDDDPAWRGDFKGLIDKLDYLKALGFSAIWLTPVVQNGGGYDYHGYHSMDMSKVDERYESAGATYQDLIDAAHEKDMKIIQDVVWNHTGNWGDAFFCPMATKEYNTIQDLASPDSMKLIPDGELAKAYPNYASLSGEAQFQARLDILQDLQHNGHNSKEYYHRETTGGGWGQPLEQYASIEGDCRDLNTENQTVANFLTDTYLQYVNMGVDAFRLDTEKHINRWTLNSAYFPKFMNSDYPNFYIFGEVCARWNQYVNEGGSSDSPFFYTWKETESPWTSNWSTDPAQWETNFNNSKAHYTQYAARKESNLTETSTNAFLSNGLTYHAPDYSKSNGTGVIDFTMHWNFENASSAYGCATGEDHAFNDSTWNVVYVDSHDYGPQFCEKVRYTGSEEDWAENMDLMWTFRGIPCIYYGTEIQFQKGQKIDVGPKAPLSTTGRAYFGDHITGNVTATGFGTYTGASGNVADTLNQPLAKHLRQLNQIRRAVPALQKGQYKSFGNMAFVRRYTANGVDSVACVAISGSATFTGLPNGTYVDAVTGSSKTVSNGTLTTESVGRGNMRVYVLNGKGKIGENGTYLK
ncbi:MAG: starch-binding protein [Ruminococcus sp.]|nr:starch-binding protein [Ruminococcus sp.]